MDPGGTEPAGGHSPRWPGLVWALAHVPLILWLYAGPIDQALRSVPAGFQAPLYPAFLVQAVTLAVALWVVALPLSVSRRLFRWIFPVITALATLVLAIDSRTYAAVGFHINGFFLRVAIQPSALRETGIPASDVAWFLAEGLGWLVAEVVVGTWFLRRFTSPRPVWKVALALLLLATGERVYSASVAFFGGPGVFAAGQALPLQVPVRMGKFWEKLTGRAVLGSPLKGVSGESAVKLPPGIEPESVKFTRTPDVVFILLESARADYLDPQVMPLLTARAARGGTVFERHYALAPTTYFTVFGLIFGLEAHKLDAVVGAGRKPLLFRAFSANGYQSKFLAASSVDWMGLREQVFGDVTQSLETDWPKHLDPEQTDGAMVKEARRFVEAAGDQPVFLFLFFVGTHFNYTYPERSARFSPVWDGAGILKASEVSGSLILNRARNSAYEADIKVDELLTWFELKRGRRPLVIVTGDHGEEMREQGHVGHGSALTVQQLHVPMVVMGDGVPVGRRDAPTSHADVVPTLMALLGDTHPPESYAAGLSMFEAPADRFVLTTVGWEPKFAAIGKDLKVSFSGMDAGFGGVTLTDPFDRPIPDGEARFTAAAPRILKLFGR
jgi:membrane-anchored protein YejM (alkaline phosphatase superfamily)